MGALNLGFAIPWRDRGRWLWEYLPEGVTGDLLLAAPEEESPRGRQKLPPYLREWFCLTERKPKLDAYDVVFAWEMRSVIAVAVMRRLSGRRRAYFVPVGPILKGGLLKILPVVRGLLGDSSRIVCFSTTECDDYARLLQMPREKFVFLPTPWRGDETETDRDDGFILALGQSNRDYGTLIRAARGTDLPILIVAADSSVLGGETLPENVTVRYGTGHDETNDLIAGASFHCIPLHAASHSAGQTVLLRAMAQGKACIVSDTPGVRDYVRPETACLVPAGDEVQLREALLRLWNDKSERKHFGHAAARAVREEFGFPVFTQHLVALARELTAQKK